MSFHYTSIKYFPYFGFRDRLMCYYCSLTIKNYYWASEHTNLCLKYRKRKKNTINNDWERNMWFRSLWSSYWQYIALSKWSIRLHRRDSKFAATSGQIRDNFSRGLHVACCKAKFLTLSNIPHFPS